MRERLKIVLQVFVLFAIGFLVYGASLSNGFVLDDTQQVVDNQLTTSLSRIRDIFLGASNETFGNLNSYGVYYRPLMISTYNLVRAVFGLNPFAFHLLQLLLHIGNAILLFFIFRSLFRNAAVLAFVGALLFLVHPLNTEAVVYIASLQDPLFSFFGLLAFLWLIRAEKIGLLWSLAFGLLVLLCVLSKETGALFVIMSLIYVGLFRKKDWRWVFGGSLLGLAAYFSLRMGVAGLISADHSSTHIARATLLERLTTVPAVLSSYLVKFIFPHSLSTNQDWLVTELTDIYFWGSLLFLVVLVAGLVWLMVKNRGHHLLWFFLLWSLAGLGLHSQLLTPLDGTVAERWFYFTSMGLVGLVAVLLSLGKATPISSRLIPSSFFAVAVVFGVLSYQRSLLWESDYTLAMNDVKVDPTSSFMQNNMGVELYKRGQPVEAIPYLEKAVELSPYWNLAWNNLGVMRQTLKDFKKAEAAFLKSIELGANALAFRNYPIVLLEQGRREEAAKFLREKAIVFFPNDPLIQELTKTYGNIPR